jgi:hypothetical protein
MTMNKFTPDLLVRYMLHRAYMKSIAFRAIKESNGYVRSSFVGNGGTESKTHVAWEFVIIGGMVVLSAAIVWLFLFAK